MREPTPGGLTRNVNFRLTLTEEEHREWSKLAAKECPSLNEWIRRRVRQAIADQGKRDST